MKNLKIGKKLLVTFGVIIALFCVTVLLSVYSLISTGNNFTAFYQKPYEVTNKTADMRRAIQEFAKLVGYSMMETDSDKTKAYISTAQEALQALRDGNTYMKDKFPEANSVMGQFESVMDGIMEERDRVLELAAENKNSEATELYFSKVMPAFVESNAILLQIDEMARKQADAYYQSSTSQKNAILIIMLILSAGVLAVTIALSLYITRSLTGPIGEIERAAKEMAEGSLNVDITYESRDELGSLSNSMRTLCDGVNHIVHDIGNILARLAEGDFHVTSQCLQNYMGDYVPILDAMRLIRDNLNDTLTQISQSSDQVASGSDQVSSGSQALSQGATEQASAVQELAATINEISSQVKETADNAAEARDEATNAGGAITACNEQMQEMIAAMDEISQKSSEIGKIIKTIEDIAFQTNILALNAAVEAARAGAAGKGFAVVADEVRNLAGKSAEASKNTSALIEGSIAAVNKGTGIANETAQSLLQVVEGAQASAVTINKIAQAATAQAASIAQVTQGIDQISSVVQTNSATAEESAAASEELSGQAQMLRSLVSRFKLLGTTDATDRSGKEPETVKSQLYTQPYTQPYKTAPSGREQNQTALKY